MSSSSGFSNWDAMNQSETMLINNIKYMMDLKNNKQKKSISTSNTSIFLSQNQFEKIDELNGRNYLNEHIVNQQQ